MTEGMGIKGRRLAEVRLSGSRLIRFQLPEVMQNEGGLTNLRGRLTKGMRIEGRLTGGRLMEGRLMESRLMEGRLTKGSLI